MQEVTTCDTDIVPALRAALAEVLGASRYELWFAAGTQLEWSGQKLRIISANAFERDYVRNNMRREVALVCAKVLGHEVPLEFDAQEGETTDLGAPIVPLRPAVNESSQPESATAESQAPAAESNRRPFSRLETFVVGRANKVAYTSAQMAADRPGSVNPLFIHGPTGVGKTHLLEGIWSSLRSRPGKHVVYLSSEQFTSLFLDALNGKGLPSFRGKYRGVDALLIDDVQFLAGQSRQ